MWTFDAEGSWLDGPDEAREELRLRARLMISAGLKEGRDLSRIRVRVRDDRDEVIFEGRMDEAAACDLNVFRLRTEARGHQVIEDTVRLRAKAVALTRASGIQRDRMRAAMSALTEEHLRAGELVGRSRERRATGR